MGCGESKLIDGEVGNEPSDQSEKDNDETAASDGGLPTPISPPKHTENGLTPIDASPKKKKTAINGLGPPTALDVKEQRRRESNASVRPMSGKKGVGKKDVIGKGALEVKEQRRRESNASVRPAPGNKIVGMKDVIGKGEDLLKGPDEKPDAPSDDILEQLRKEGVLVEEEKANNGYISFEINADVLKVRSNRPPHRLQTLMKKPLSKADLEKQLSKADRRRKRQQRLAKERAKDRSLQQIDKIADMVIKTEVSTDSGHGSSSGKSSRIGSGTRQQSAGTFRPKSRDASANRTRTDIHTVTPGAPLGVASVVTTDPFDLIESDVGGETDVGRAGESEMRAVPSKSLVRNSQDPFSRDVSVVSGQDNGSTRGCVDIGRGLLKETGSILSNAGASEKSIVTLASGKQPSVSNYETNSRKSSVDLENVPHRSIEDERPSDFFNTSNFVDGSVASVGGSLQLAGSKRNSILSPLTSQTSGSRKQSLDRDVSGDIQHNGLFGNRLADELNEKKCDFGSLSSIGGGSGIPGDVKRNSIAGLSQGSASRKSSLIQSGSVDNKAGLFGSVSEKKDYFGSVSSVTGSVRQNDGRRNFGLATLEAAESVCSGKTSIEQTNTNLLGGYALRSLNGNNTGSASETAAARTGSVSSIGGTLNASEFRVGSNGRPSVSTQGSGSRKGSLEKPGAGLSGGVLFDVGSLKNGELESEQPVAAVLKSDGFDELFDDAGTSASHHQSHSVRGSVILEGDQKTNVVLGTYGSGMESYGMTEDLRNEGSVNDRPGIHSAFGGSLVNNGILNSYCGLSGGYGGKTPSIGKSDRTGSISSISGGLGGQGSDTLPRESLDGKSNFDERKSSLLDHLSSINGSDHPKHDSFGIAGGSVASKRSSLTGSQISTTNPVHTKFNEDIYPDDSVSNEGRFSVFGRKNSDVIKSDINEAFASKPSSSAASHASANPVDYGFNANVKSGDSVSNDGQSSLFGKKNSDADGTPAFGGLLSTNNTGSDKNSVSESGNKSVVSNTLSKGLNKFGGAGKKVLFDVDEESNVSGFSNGANGTFGDALVPKVHQVLTGMSDQMGDVSTDLRETDGGNKGGYTSLYGFNFSEPVAGKKDDIRVQSGPADVDSDFDF